MNLTIKRLILLLLLYFFYDSCAKAENDFYVSINGDDQAEGSSLRPVRTFTRVQELIRATKSKSIKTIHIGSGEWYLDKPLIFTEADSYTFWQGSDRTIISGGKVIDNWKLDDHGNWVANLSGSGYDKQGGVRELFINGVRRMRARHPNKDYFRVDRPFNDKRNGFYYLDDLPPKMDEENVELVFFHDWSTSRMQVSNIDTQSKSLTVKHPIGMSPKHYAIDHFEEHPRFYLENSLNYLDAPGEWVFNSETGAIIYKPFPDERIDMIRAIVPVSEGLIRIVGEVGKKVRNISFRNIEFVYSYWSPPESGYAEGQSAVFENRNANQTERRLFAPAAIEVKHTNECLFSDIQVLHMGGNGIWIGRDTQNCKLSDSHVSDISANGVMIGEGVERMVGAIPWFKTAPSEVASGNMIEKNTIENTGVQFHGAVGVWVGLTQFTRIVGNIVRFLPYTGISLGWIWSDEVTPAKQNLIEGNVVHNVMTTLSDGAGIYTLGRQDGSRITNNVIVNVEGSHGRAENNGIYFDQGSKGFLVDRNKILCVKNSPFRAHMAKGVVVVDNFVSSYHSVQLFRLNNTSPKDVWVKNLASLPEFYDYDCVKFKDSDIHN